MKNLLVLMVIVVSTFSFQEANAEAAKINSEFGKFEFKQAGEGCQISFLHKNGKKLKVFDHDYCSEEGLNSLTAIDTISKFNFPIKNECGEEVHIFGTSTAGGGNACEGNTFWSVFIDKKMTWSTEPFGGCSYIKKIERNIGGKKCQLSVYLDPSPSELENRFDIKMGETKNVVISREGLKKVDEKTVTITGKFFTGSHATSFLPSVEVEDYAYLIDKPGICKLEKLRDGTIVEIEILTKKWDNGTEESTCNFVRKK